MSDWQPIKMPKPLLVHRIVEGGVLDEERGIYVPIPAARREAAGKIGDENAPQEEGSEVDPRRLPDV